jgi:hypothetical protein
MEGKFVPVSEELVRATLQTLSLFESMYYDSGGVVLGICNNI